MNHSTLFIKAIDYNDNDDIHYDIRLSGMNSSCAIDFYGTENEFKDFASQLCDFPQNLESEIIFEIGAPSTATYLKLKVWCYDPNGHASISVLMQSLIGRPSGYRCEFNINREIAFINRLGTELKNWTPKKRGDEFESPEM